MKNALILLLTSLFFNNLPAQKSIETDCQPAEGYFSQTDNKSGFDYLLFSDVKKTHVDTVLHWQIHPKTSPFSDCIIQDSIAVFLSMEYGFYYLGKGYGLHIIKKQNSSWRKVAFIPLDYTDYSIVGLTYPYTRYTKDFYAFVDHNTLLRTTHKYSMTEQHRKKEDGTLEYIPLEERSKETTYRRYKIDYEKMKLIETVEK